MRGGDIGGPGGADEELNEIKVRLTDHDRDHHHDTRRQLITSSQESLGTTSATRPQTIQLPNRHQPATPSPGAGNSNKDNSRGSAPPLLVAVSEPAPNQRQGLPPQPPEEGDLPPPPPYPNVVRISQL